MTETRTRDTSGERRASNRLRHEAAFRQEFFLRRGVVGRIPAFQPGDSGLIPGGVRNFSFYPGIGCVVCMCSVLCCFLRRPGTIHSVRSALMFLSSVLVRSLLLPLQASDPRAFGLYLLRNVSFTLGRVNNSDRKTERIQMNLDVLIHISLSKISLWYRKEIAFAEYLVQSRIFP